MSLHIIPVQSPIGDLFTEVYDLLTRTFEPDIMDSKDAMVEDLEETLLGQADAPFIILAGLVDDEVVSVRLGNYMRMQQHRGQAFGAGMYGATLPSARRQGYARELWKRFQSKLDEYAREDSRSLRYLVLEAETPSEGREVFDPRPAWSHVGFRFPGGTYRQPATKFDPKTGTLTKQPVPLTFMIKDLGGTNGIDPVYLRDVVTTLFDNWYVPEREDFENDNAHAAAVQHVIEIREAYLDSLQPTDRGEILLHPLRL